jgi:hypothetical protein
VISIAPVAGTRVAAGTEPAAIERVAAAAERFCVNADTLRSGVVMHVGLESPPDRS